MSLLDEVRGAVREIAADTDLDDLRYPLTGTWSDGISRRYSVKDPNRGSGAKGMTQLQTDPVAASLRLLRLRPGDPSLDPGASVPYQHGTLVFGFLGDASEWTDQAPGICRLVDARAYPTAATTASGAAFRLRIEALDTAALSVSGDQTAASNNSHRAYLPPGLQLQPGEAITTADGDGYLVVPPVGRDPLGDVVGLSWRGSPASGLPAPLPPPDSPDPTPEPSPPSPPVSAPSPADAWWDEGLPP